MTEKEKALTGLEFTRGDPDLKAVRDRAEALCFRLNHTSPAEAAEREKLLRELIGEIRGSFSIKPPFYCDYGTYISLGDNFFANYGCMMLDGGRIAFGDNVLVGPGCVFVTAAHPTEPEKRLAGKQTFRPVTVGSNVWFGANATICPGVSIGDNTVIGAGSVVTRDIPANCVAAGNPCRVIRECGEPPPKTE